MPTDSMSLGVYRGFVLTAYSRRDGWAGYASRDLPVSSQSELPRVRISLAASGYETEPLAAELRRRVDVWRSENPSAAAP